MRRRIVPYQDDDLRRGRGAPPWGLHDAYLEGIVLDWLGARLELEVRLMMSEHQDMDQRACVTVTGLVYCAIDPPEIDPTRG